jgi:hypothetical protein
MNDEQVRALHARMDAFMPRLAGGQAQSNVRQLFRGELPAGADWDARGGRTTRQANGWGGHGDSGAYGGGSGSWGGSMQSLERPYQPEFACFPAGTPVAMADGTYRTIESIKVGDRVIDRHGKAATVARAWCEGVPETLTEIKLVGGKTILSTANHRFPVWAWARTCACGCGLPVKPGRVCAPAHKPPQGSLYVDGGTSRTSATPRRIPVGFQPFQKLEAQDIRRDDFLLMPRGFDVIDVDIDPAKARLLGYYLAEGNPISKGKDLPMVGLQFSFGSHEDHSWVADTRAILEALGVPCTVKIDSVKNHVASIRTTNERGALREEESTLTEWMLANAGRYSHGKHLSEEVMRWNLDLKMELIRGLFRGDGSQIDCFSEKDGHEGHQFLVVWSTVSPVLWQQVQLVLAQLGYPTTQINLAPGGIGKLPAYRLTVAGDKARELADLIWGDASRAKGHPKKQTQRSSMRVDDLYVYLRVKSIDAKPNTLPVFNLSVSGDASYMTQNIGTFNSPDRQQYPVHRILANRYWRLFFKLDPVIGTGIDMYAEMPWGDSKLSGEGMTGEIRECYETSWEAVQIPQLLAQIVREYLVVGEAIPHLFWSNEESCWTYCAMHNPDSLEVIDSQMIAMNPIVEFVPDDKLRQILVSPDPDLARIREGMPPELLQQLYARQNIRLDTDLNATFIARKLHPYETRGTSILSRMWRVLMYEDAVFSASIATARRHAGPLKIAKLGNAQTNWVPGPEHERRFLELVAQAEMDPHAWVVYHYGLQLEAFGTTDRVMNIGREWDVIERIKLVALGISKSFLTGELTFASATAGLQVFLRRLLAMRTFFTEVWLKPKFFLPIAMINNFVKPTTAEVNHRIKVKRSPTELRERKRYITPTVEWANKLNPQIDKDLIDAYKKLEEMGIRISKTKKAGAANLSYEDETRRGIEEDQLEAAVRKEHGVEDEKGDPEKMQQVIDANDPAKKKDKDDQAKANPPQEAKQPPSNPRWRRHGSVSNVDNEAAALVALIADGKPSDDFWASFGAEEISAILEPDGWDIIEPFLDDKGISDEDQEVIHDAYLYAVKYRDQEDVLRALEEAVDQGELPDLESVIGKLG